MMLLRLRPIAAVVTTSSLALLACAQTQDLGPTSPSAPGAQRDASSSVAEIPAPPTPPPSAASLAALGGDAAPAKEVDVPLTLEQVIASCVATSKVSKCVPVFKGKMDDFANEDVKKGAECTSTCIGNRDERLASALSEQHEACKKAYLANNGDKKKAKCTFPKPPKLRDPRELSMRFQDALRAAVEKGDSASLDALDAVVPLMDAKWLVDQEKECTERCHTAAAELLGTPPSAPAKPIKTPKP